MTQLRFHQKTFDFLGLTPRLSEAHKAGLQRLAELLPVTIPASIIEWYSQEQCVEMMGQGTAADHRYPSPVGTEEDLLLPQYAFPRYEEDGTDGRWCLYDREDEPYYHIRKWRFDATVSPKIYLPVVIENQGVVRHFAWLDGSEDPPVYNDGDSKIVDQWLCVSDTFSGFVYDWITFFHDTIE